MLSVNATFLVQLVFFLAFMAIVNVFLFRPMRHYLARRQRTIDNLRASASGSESTIAELSANYARRLAEARDEMTGCRASARKDGLAKQQQILDEAKRQAIIEVNTAEDELAKELASAREHLQRETASLAASIAGKVLGRAH